jgi:hypothetical protein
LFSYPDKGTPEPSLEMTVDTPGDPQSWKHAD